MKFLIFLAATYFTTFYSPPGAPTERFSLAGHYFTTTKGFQKCTTSLLNEMNAFGYFNLTKVCKALTPFDNSLKSIIPGCEESDAMVTAIEQIFKFVCTKEGRAMVAEMKNSACYNDERRALVLAKGIHELCIVKFKVVEEINKLRSMYVVENEEGELGNYTPTNDFKECAVRIAGKEICGEAYEAFLNHTIRITDRVMRDKLQPKEEL